MTRPPDRRSRELRYYYDRRQRGDHLHRLWADAETSRKFTQLCDNDSGEATFRRIVELAYEQEGLA